MKRSMLGAKSASDSARVTLHDGSPKVALQPYRPYRFSVGLPAIATMAA